MFFKRIAGQSKNWGKPVIKPKERGGGGNGQLTACVGGRQEDIFIAGLVERRQPRIKWDGTTASRRGQFSITRK